ncbi:hypothetical protein [Haloplanus halobius]|uniref:hypothetical protein n=1 Tax=Haloplanus halobius TaxID=2934938 RepID=UPI00200DADB6|nr:hypothetical protein [Haloplanus sp. XH21]
MIPGLDSATINVLIGAGIAMFSSAFLNWNQRRVERDRFRRSLIHEVDHVAETLDDLLDEGSGECTVTDVEEALVSLSPDVLDADPARMSKLTSKEIESVYEFYEATRLVTAELERRREGRDHDPERLYRHARRAVELRDEVTADITRSRLSRLTEWYKDIDSGRR